VATLTIFEMLERLETEIVSLQMRYRNLASSLEHQQQNGSTRPVTAPKRKVARKKKPVKVAAKRSKRKEEPTQMELPVSEAAPAGEEHPERALGKRQALGRSLLQLRKMSAWRTSHPPHSSEN
jgi:hypothetical protein